MKPPTLAHRLMARLKQEPGRVVPHDALYRAMWPDGAPERRNEVLREIACRIRRGLPPGHALIAIWGKGYVARSAAPAVAPRRRWRRVLERMDGVR